jgi:hypothetical protein
VVNVGNFLSFHALTASCLCPLTALMRAALASSAFIHGYAALVFAIAVACAPAVPERDSSVDVGKIRYAVSGVVVRCGLVTGNRDGSQVLRNGRAVSIGLGSNFKLVGAAFAGLGYLQGELKLVLSRIQKLCGYSRWCQQRSLLRQG